MSDHLTTEQIERLVARRLEPAKLPSAARHLSGCEDCRALVNRMHRTPARIASLASHLESEDAAAGRLAARRPFDAWKAALAWRPLAISFALALLLLAAGIGLHRSLRRARRAPAVAALPSPFAAASPAPAFSVALDDHGLRVGLDRDGNPEGLPEIPADLARAVRLALARRQVEKAPALNALARDSITLMGETNASVTVRLLEPVGVVLRDARPLFRWEPIEGAESYVVSVLDADFTPVAVSGPLTRASWRPVRALPLGRDYVWQVTALVGERQLSSASASAPESRFNILGRAQRDALDRRLAEYEQSSLLRGLLYARAGLLADAEREFRLLQRENPESPVVPALLRQLRPRSSK
ncbi:MAG: hypothetical protein ACKVX9_00845 [Blastocatellia bacterium]